MLHSFLILMFYFFFAVVTSETKHDEEIKLNNLMWNSNSIDTFNRKNKKKKWKKVLKCADLLILI